MSEIKPGDRVWIKLPVAFVHDPMVGLAANPAWAEMGVAQVSALESELLPDHPALPAVARWLRETPDAAKWLQRVRQLAEAAPVLAYHRENDFGALTVIEQFISALEAGS